MIIKNKHKILGQVIIYYCTAINNPICKTRLIDMQLNVMKKINTRFEVIGDKYLSQWDKFKKSILKDYALIYLLSFCLTEAKSWLQGFKVNTILANQYIRTNVPL